MIRLIATMRPYCQAFQGGKLFMIPLQSVVQFVEGTNIKVLTIIVVLVTDMFIAANSITQPASAFRNVINRML